MYTVATEKVRLAKVAKNDAFLLARAKLMIMDRYRGKKIIEDMRVKVINEFSKAWAQ